ncbi:MAG: dGTP triphosphohydrolase [Armatimonadota bacterium]
MHKGFRTKKDILDFETFNLADYATKSKDTIGRKYIELEPDCDLRTPFQRDIGRIVHSAAFRRLQYKAQIFPAQQDDFTRSRLTHTIAVSQIAKTISRALRANEDLAEAIALAHDIGHPPFGHLGEEFLNDLMKEYGGFEHNSHALRVVDVLEYRTSSYKGLNLSYEVREGIAKHRTIYDNPMLNSEFGEYPSPSLEAQIVNLADSIAYTSHDLEDGFMVGLISPEELNQQAPQLWLECLPKNDVFSTPEDIMIGAQRKLINALIWDVVLETVRNIESLNPKCPDDIRKHSELVVRLSKKVKKDEEELGKYLRSKLYAHPEVLARRELAESALKRVFNYYLENPLMSSLPKHVIETSGIYRIACDATASLTDRAVLNLSNSPYKLFEYNV